MDRLNSKVAVVTGAASGIGEGIARMFAREGARVILTDLNTARGTDIADEIVAEGGTARFVRADVTDKETIHALRDAAVEEFGGVDVLVNSAGVLVNGSFLDLTDADFDTVMRINLRGPIWMMQTFLPLMVERGGGSVINIASISAVWPESNAYFYGAAKAAIAKLSRDVAREFARQSVRINAILPGPTDTPLVPSFVRDDPQTMQSVIDNQAILGRLSRPDDIAYAAVYLASDESAMVTGQQMVVDSGVTISNA